MDLLLVPEKSQAAKLLRTGRTATTQSVSVNAQKELWDGKRPVITDRSAKRELQWLRTSPLEHGDHRAGTRHPHEQPTNL